MKAEPTAPPPEAAPTDRKAQAEASFTGLGVAPGIAIGPAHVVESGAVDVPVYEIPPEGVSAERERFGAAVALAQRQIGRLRAKVRNLRGSAAEELGYLLDAHAQMLKGSRLVRGVERRIADRRINAEAAVHEELAEITRAFAGMTDAYLAARVQDVRDVGARLVRSLTNTPYKAFTGLPKGTLVVAEELTPADIALMDPQRVGGFATALGGAEGHTAIMARSLGLPAVVGVPGLVNKVRSGDPIVIDGQAGRVVVHPGAETLTRYELRQQELRRQERQLARLKSLPAVTRDGVNIALQANVELPSEVEMALGAGAEGIGLVRTEFVYMNRDDLPGEDEQYRKLRDIVEGMHGRPVTLRTLDVGSDKLAYSLDSHIIDSVNPALGLRAIRLSLKMRPLLETQLAAMLRAGAHGPIRILLPMIGTASEVRKVREALTKVVRRLRRRRVPIAEPLPPVGAMIEIPGAALAADSLARVCDFLSIGTNDLTMYTLAIDRGDEQVAHLYDPLHPAVLRLIQFTAEAAFRAEIPVNVCGEMAGDPRYTALLLGLGLRELSMAATNLPRVKQRLRGLSLDEATKRVRTIMEQSDSGVIAVLLDDFNALL
ncbi:MAG: phosphoenolpyruvate--protein phosphotransferase [Alphaproteobacteria bacterium]